MRFPTVTLLAVILLSFGWLSKGEVAFSQNAAKADVSNDPINRIKLGLFNWQQYPNGNMIASFVMSNFGDRDIRELTITCDYVLKTSNYRRHVAYTLKDDELTTRLDGEFSLRAHTGRHYTEVNFGSIDPATSIRYMACRVSNVKF